MFAGWATLKANTAVSIVLLSVALLAPPGSGRLLPAMVAGGIAGTALFEWLTDYNLGVDELLVGDPASLAAGQPPGRMAVATAIGLLLISFAALASSMWPMPAQCAALGALAIGWIAIVGYATELGPLWSVWLYGTVSAPTALSLVLLAVSALLLRPHVGLAAALTGPDTGALLLRRLAPPAALLPALSALVAGRLVERAGLQAGFGVAIAATIDASVFLALLASVASAARRQELARAEAETAVRENERRLGELSRALLEAHEAERREIAKELHDELGQGLMGLSLLIERASRDPNALSGARELLLGLTTNVRSLALNLRPSMLDDLGLMPALSWLALRYPGLTIELAAQGEPRRYPTAVETAAYRIAQEALTNVARHAKTERAELIIEFGDDILLVEVLDEGVGFDCGEVVSMSTGLSGMRERALAVGGQLDVRSRPGHTSIRATLPTERARV